MARPLGSRGCEQAPLETVVDAVERHEAAVGPGGQGGRNGVQLSGASKVDDADTLRSRSFTARSERALTDAAAAPEARRCDRGVQRSSAVAASEAGGLDLLAGARQAREVEKDEVLEALAQGDEIGPGHEPENTTPVSRIIEKTGVLSASLAMCEPGLRAIRGRSLAAQAGPRRVRWRCLGRPRHERNSAGSVLFPLLECAAALQHAPAHLVAVTESRRARRLYDARRGAAGESGGFHRVPCFVIPDQGTRPRTRRLRRGVYLRARQAPRPHHPVARMDLGSLPAVGEHDQGDVCEQCTRALPRRPPRPHRTGIRRRRPPGRRRDLATHEQRLCRFSRQRPATTPARRLPKLPPRTRARCPRGSRPQRAPGVVLRGRANHAAPARGQCRRRARVVPAVGGRLPGRCCETGSSHESAGRRPRRHGARRAPRTRARQP